jgi:hypothetical protein
MAFNVGDIVVSIGIAQIGQPAFAGTGLPLLGGIESDSLGNAVVCWSNGTRTTVTADAVNSLVSLKTTSPAAIAIYHKRVTIDPATLVENPPAAANGLGASEGIVIAVCTLFNDIDVAFVEFTGGDIWPIAASLLLPF